MYLRYCDVWLINGASDLELWIGAASWLDNFISNIPKLFTIFWNSLDELVAFSYVFIRSSIFTVFFGLQACVELSRNVGQLRTETELLPQCWEQVDSIYSLLCSILPEASN